MQSDPTLPQNPDSVSASKVKISRMVECLWTCLSTLSSQSSGSQIASQSKAMAMLTWVLCTKWTTNMQLKPMWLPIRKSMISMILLSLTRVVLNLQMQLNWDLIQRVELSTAGSAQNLSLNTAKHGTTHLFLKSHPMLSETLVVRCSKITGSQSRLGA